MKNLKKLLSIYFLMTYGLLIGQTPSLQWAKSIGGTKDDDALSIAIDASGNTYLTGYFSGTADFDPSASVFNMTAIGYHDLFVSKLDASGNFVWAIQVGGNSGNVHVEGNAIAVDASGNAYVTGQLQYTADFDPGPGVFNLSSAGGFDVFVLKLNPSGNFVFAKRMGGTNTDQPWDIKLDVSGNIYTTGVFLDASDFDPGPAVFNIYAAQWGDAFVSKLDPAGNFLWAKSFGGSGYDISFSLTTDSSGNVYTTGRFEETADFNPGAGTFNLTSAGNEDAFVCKLDSSGNFIWAGRMGGTGVDQGWSVTVDASGNIYSTGSFQGNGTEDFDPGSGVFNLPSAGGSGDLYILKLNTAGNFTWASSIGGKDGDCGNSILLDVSGNIYITGYFHGTIDFDPGVGVFNLTDAGNVDIFILKLDNARNLIYAGNMGGMGADIGKDIALDPSGFPCIVGAFQQTADFDPTGGVVNCTSLGGVYDVFVMKLGLIAPTISMSSNKTICSGQSISITATGGLTPGPYTYSWTPTGSLDNAIIPDPIATPTVTTTYTCIVTDSKLTKNTGTVTITVSPLPIAIPSTSSPTVCSGQQTNILLSSSVAGTTYSWKPILISGMVTGQSAGTASVISQVLTGEGVINYVITPVAKGCTGSDTTMQISVKANLSVITQPYNSFVCEGDNTSFSIVASNVIAYQWQINTGTGFKDIAEALPYSTTQTSSLTITGVSNPLTAYQYKVVMSNSCGNLISSNSVKISTTDTVKPVFTKCPVNDTIQAGVYNYNNPVATDNCTKNVTIIHTAGLNSGAIFPEGNTVETYEATDKAGNKSVCSFIVTAKKITSTGSIISENDIRIYPNPASDKIIILFPTVQWNNFSVVLKDVTGKTIWKNDFSSPVSDLTLDVKNIVKGIYFLSIYNKDLERIEKIVIE
jgi:hypothetical protein